MHRNCVASPTTRRSAWATPITCRRPTTCLTLQWFPGDREARVVDIETPAGQGVSAQQVARCVDLTLERSGEDFPVDDLVEVARWGHFEKADYPWEQIRRI